MKGNNKNKVLNWKRICIWMILLVLSMFIISDNFEASFGATKLQMEWDKINITPETWHQINLSTFYEDPIVVATPEYSITTINLGISTWVTNVTNTSFMLRTSDEDFTAADNIYVHYMVVERGNWNFPNSGLKIEAGSISTNKVGTSGGNWGCPTYGETVTFATAFSSNPLVFSVRGSNNNPSSWSATIVSNNDGTSEVGTSNMCVGLSQSKATAPGAITNNEIIYWIAMDTGNGTEATSEFESLWQLDDTGTSGANWINGYGDAKPFTQNWAHTWTGAPNIIIASQTSIRGSDGSWPVIYDTGNTVGIRMFVDEPNERAHAGSESGGGLAFNNASSIIAPAEVSWESSSLDLGFGVITDGNLTNTIKINSYKNNNNINITCESGNCSNFVTNYTTITNMSFGDELLIEFTCLNSSVNIFNATFSVSSDNDTSNDLINVSCQIFKVYGDLSSSLDIPLPLSITQIAQNRTYSITSTVNCIGDPGTVCGNITGTIRYNGTISNFGDGSDGSLTVNLANTIINDYAYLTGNEFTGDSTITVSGAGAYSPGDEVLIISMQNSSGGTAGVYEFKIIESISSNDITFTTSLENDYYSGTFDSTSATVSQIVRVPQYNDVTVNGGASIVSRDWDGYTGGIIIFRANGIVDTTGYINISGRGFRGGDCNGCGNNAWGDQGEGISGFGIGDLAANGIGGGGGYGPSGYNGEPGAGGGHATAGGNGVSSFTSIGGGTIGSANLTTIHFGGGAGGGGDNDNVAPNPEYTDGGGIAIIFGKKMINAKIDATGMNGIAPGGAGGTSGGGAGGTIWISSENLTISNVDANGGIGGVDADDTSGNGGDGRIRLDYNLISGSPSPAAGFTGPIQTQSSMIPISNTSGDNPLFVIESQPQSCNSMNQSDSCILSWTVNATGPINSTYLFDILYKSNIPVVTDSITENATIKITDNQIPQFILFTPIGKTIYDEDWSKSSITINGNYICRGSPTNNVDIRLTASKEGYITQTKTVRIRNNFISLDEINLFNFEGENSLIRKE